jgi:hypothetical protein
MHSTLAIADLKNKWFFIPTGMISQDPRPYLVNRMGFIPTGTIPFAEWLAPLRSL